MAIQNFTYDPNDQSYAQTSGAPTGLPSLFGGLFGRRQSGTQNYTYDPTTQEYSKVNPSGSGLLSLLSSGSAFGDSFFGRLMGGIFSGLFGGLQSRIPQSNNFNYDPSSQQYSLVGKKEGGEISMNSYAQGGLAAAQHAQSQGRGQDTMLVHMTPKEVAGLQALAMSRGGSLTINPHTGLPEAGFLSSILPMVAGAALTAFTGIPAWQIALGVGGATALATGSLKKGLMAGLGAYGGAGIGSGLTAAGSAAEAGSMANLASATDVAAQGAGQVGNVGYSAIPSELGGSFVSPTAGAGASYFVPEAGAAGLVNVGMPTGVSGLQAMAQGVPALTSEAGRDAFMQQIGGTKGLLQAGLPLAGSVLSGMTPEQPKLQKKQAYIRPYELQVANTSGLDAYMPGSSEERRMLSYNFAPQPIYTAAEGGLAALQSGGEFDDSRAPDMEPGYAEGGTAKKRKPTSIAGDPWYKMAQDRRDTSMEASVNENFAAGGALPPRFLSGGGDGMSDSIRANIDGKQEARLSDSEFVVPADVVSHLGNGSSKAGAKRLYSMMDRVRKARTGQKRQAPEINAERYMPA